MSSDKILPLFQDLDKIVHPLGIQPDGFPLIFKSYASLVESFLKNMKLHIFLQPPHKFSSWAQIFNLRMKYSKKLLFKDRYEQYVESMKFYTQLVRWSELRQSNGSSSSGTSKHDKYLVMANEFLDFLEVHKVDTDSSLIGLSPSDYVLQECMTQERSLPLKLRTLKEVVEDPQQLKAEVKNMIGMANGVFAGDGGSVPKGEIIVIKRKGDYYFARYTGEHSNDCKYLTVWPDVTETAKERVPWNDIYFLPHAIQQVIISYNAADMGALVRNPIKMYYVSLASKTQNALQKFLGYPDTHPPLNMAEDKLTFVEIEELAGMKEKLSVLTQAKPHFLLVNLDNEIQLKIEKIKRKYLAKIFVPLQHEFLQHHEEFMSNISFYIEQHIVGYQKQVDLAFDFAKRSYIDGVKKDEFNEWVLMHIDNQAAHFLESIGFDYAAVPDNYISTPPASLSAIVRNIAMLKVLMDRRSKLPTFVTEVCTEINSKVEKFIQQYYIAFSAELQPKPAELANSSGAATLIKSMREILANKKRELTSEKCTFYADHLRQLEVLLEMTIERYDSQSSSVNEVTYGGLVVSPFVRLLEECSTVYEVWHPKEHPPERFRRSIDEFSMEYLLWAKERVKNNRNSRNMNSPIPGSNGTPNFETRISRADTIEMIEIGMDGVGTTALHQAVSNCDMNMIFELVAAGECDVNALDGYGWTALHCAAYNVSKMNGDLEDSMEVLKLLLILNGVDVTIQSRSKNTVMHILARTPAEHPDTDGLLGALDLMRIKGVCVFQPNKQEEIPLHLACLGGNPDIALFLLAAGSDPNAITRAHQSCLHYAIHKKHTAVVKVLLTYGADHTILSPEGTPMDIARKYNCSEILKILEAHTLQLLRQQ